MARIAASTRWGGGRKPKATGSPMFKYRTRRPRDSTARASATIFRTASENRPVRAAPGLARATFEVGILRPLLRGTTQGLVALSIRLRRNLVDVIFTAFRSPHSGLVRKTRHIW